MWLYYMMLGYSFLEDIMVFRYLMIYGHWILVQLPIFLKSYVLPLLTRLPHCPASCLLPSTFYLPPSTFNLRHTFLLSPTPFFMRGSGYTNELTIDYFRSGRNKELSKWYPCLISVASSIPASSAPILLLFPLYTISTKSIPMLCFTIYLYLLLSIVNLNHNSCLAPLSLSDECSFDFPFL